MEKIRITDRDTAAILLLKAFAAINAKDNELGSAIAEKSEKGLCTVELKLNGYDVPFAETIRAAWELSFGHAVEERARELVSERFGSIYYKLQQLEESVSETVNEIVREQ